MVTEIEYIPLDFNSKLKQNKKVKVFIIYISQ
jgi:hypothetical protein